MGPTVTIALVCIVILCIAFIFVGIWFSKMAKTSEDFLLAGRGAPFWLLATAYLGGYVGGASVSGYVGNAYGSGISQLWASLWVVVGVFFFVVFFVRRINYFGRKTGAVTISDFLCARYGEKMRAPAAIVAVLRPAILTGMQFLAIATAMTVVFGTSTAFGVISSSLIILLYLITAGQFSALITQWFQAILQSIGIVLFAIVAFKMLGDPTEVTQAFFQYLPDNITNIFAMDFSSFTVYFMTLGLFYLIDPWGFMYAYMGKSPKSTSNSMMSVLCGNYYNVLPFLSGIAILLGATMGKWIVPEGLSSDGLYVWFTLNSTNVFVGTVILVGLLMTIISCGSAFAMNGVTIITRDLYQKIINKNATDKQVLRASRISVVIVVIIGIASALWLPILVPLWVLAQAIVLSGLFMPTMCAWFWKRATTAGAIASTISGAGAAIAWAMYAWITTGSPGTIIFGLHACHVGTFISIPVMIIVSLCTKADPEMAKATNWKILGEEMKATDLIPESEKCLKKGIFGWLGADTKGWKIFWVVMAILFVAHFVLSIGFNNSNLAVGLSWVSLGVGVLMLIILAVNGGRDLAGMIKDNKAALTAKAEAEEK